MVTSLSHHKQEVGMCGSFDAYNQLLLLGIGDTLRKQFHQPLRTGDQYSRSFYILVGENLCQ